MKIIIYLLSTLLALSQEICAQEKWSLNDCIQYSLENNLTLEMRQNDISHIEQDVRSAKASYLPNVGASLSASLNFGRSVDPETNTISNESNYSNSIGVSSKLNIFQGFYRHYTLKAKKYALKVGIENEIIEENALVLSITEAFYRLQYAKEKQNASKSQLNLSKQQLYRVEKMVEIGKMSEVSKLELLSQKSDDEYNLLLTQNEVANAKNDLCRLINCNDDDFDIDLETTNTKTVLQSAQPHEIYALASKSLPKIKALDYKLQVYNYNISIQRSGKLPSLSLSAGVGTGYNNINSNSYKDQLKNNQNEYIAAALSIPIFSRFSNQIAIKQAKLSYNNQQLNLQQIKITLLKDIERVCLDYNASLGLVQASLKKLDYAKLTFHEMKRKFEVGIATSTELFSMQNGLLEAENEASKARINFEIQKLWLHYYQTGRVFQENK